MGSFISKPDFGDMETVFPATVVDASKAGDTYLVIFDVSSAPASSAPSLIPKRAHHALIIDIAGESTNMQLVYGSFVDADLLFAPG